MAPEPQPTRGDLERVILGEVPVFSLSDLEESGLEPTEMRRLWRALGLPVQEDGVGFTSGDADTLRGLTEAAREGVLDLDTLVEISRAVGQTMSRLADWEVSSLMERVGELAGRDADAPAAAGRLEAAIGIMERHGDLFERLLVNGWRRHLAAAVSRVEGLEGVDDAPTALISVGFADLVSFTALSNRLEDALIGDLVEVFESRCHDVIQSNGGRLIKSLGDSVLFVNDDAVRALDIAEGIIKVIGRDQRMPDVRVGIASGHVVTRLGDVFGPPVNMAARLTNVARRNRVIIDEATAAQLPERDFEMRPLPARPLRGFGVLEPITVRRI